MTESSVGYSPGAGALIATHKINDGSNDIHHQRFAVGTGRAQMYPVIQYTTTIDTTSALSCLGAGRVVLAPLCTTDGCQLRIHFFDDNGHEMGASDLIEPLITGWAAYGQFGTGWTAATTYTALQAIKISANSHLYLNITNTGGVYESGDSGGSEPTWPTDGSTVVDNEITWLDVGLYTSLENTPLVVFSNSMGAASYIVDVETIAGGLVVFADAI